MYEIHDSYGVPQCGVDIKSFDDWYELQEYIEVHEDVYNRICEGYAIIIECD